jgi:hypothetical protein
MTNYNNYELVASVDLNYKDKNGKPVYHFIYASQLHHTMYGIYANFIGSEVDLGNDQKGYSISQISLLLINYKGTINIGFTEDKPNHIFDIVDKIDNINFNVQGLCTKMSTHLPINDPLNNPVIDCPIKVPKGGRLPIIFNRQSLPLDTFQKYFDEREDPSGQIDTQSSKLVGKTPPISQFFDEEFNDRDGVDFYNRELKPGMLGYPPEKAAGIRCNYSLVNLSF